MSSTYRSLYCIWTTNQRPNKVRRILLSSGQWDVCMAWITNVYRRILYVLHTNWTA